MDRLATIVCVVLATCASAQAQSANDGFDPGANADVYAVAVQTDGKVLVGGAFTTLGGGGTGTTARNRIGRLNVDGSIDTSFDPGSGAGPAACCSGSFVWTIAVQTDGKILVGGDFTTLGGSTRNRIGRLNADGSLDTSFNPSADATVQTLVVQSDGKILVAGAFTTLNGSTRNRIGRLNADGSLDTGFDPGADSTVYALAVQTDGKIVVGGQFTTLGGGGTGRTTRFRIGRLNVDGSLDAFNPNLVDSVRGLAIQADGKIVFGAAGFTTTPSNKIGRLNVDGSRDTSFDPGANGEAAVLVVAVQPDGKILVGGTFSKLGGGGATPRNRLGRLNADGSLDALFDPGANDIVYALAVQPDGKIVVGGRFTNLGGGGTGTTARARIGRLYGDGSLETDLTAGPNGNVLAIGLQPDGKILVGGDFSAFNTTSGALTRNRLGRLNPDGSVDAFDPGANSTVYTFSVQPEGGILVGGDFTTLGGGGAGGATRNRIGRLNADGSADSSFDPGADGSIYAMAIQPDGKILVGGRFRKLGGGGTGTTVRNRIARLNADGTLDTAFDPGASDAVLPWPCNLTGRSSSAGISLDSAQPRAATSAG